MNDDLQWELGRLQSMRRFADGDRVVMDDSTPEAPPDGEYQVADMSSKFISKGLTTAARRKRMAKALEESAARRQLEDAVEPEYGSGHNSAPNYSDDVTDPALMEQVVRLRGEQMSSAKRDRIQPRVGYPSPIDTSIAAHQATPINRGVALETIYPERVIDPKRPPFLKPLPKNNRAQALIDHNEEIAQEIAGRIRGFQEANPDSRAQYFYHTGPIREAAVKSGLSPQEADEWLEDFGKYYAATSPRTDTEQNIRNALLLMARKGNNQAFDEVSGKLSNDGEGINPLGFASMMGERGIHRKLATAVENEGLDVNTNTKPTIFSHNVTGNLSGVTADTHAIRGALDALNTVRPGAVPPDFILPRFRQAYADDPTNFDPATWVADTLTSQAEGGAKRQVEYGPVAQVYHRVANILGIQPAEAQALGWFASGNRTGLTSADKTISDLLAERIDVTAQGLKMTPDEVAEKLFRRKIPLMATAPLIAEPILHDTGEDPGMADGGRVAALEDGGALTSHFARQAAKRPPAGPVGFGDFVEGAGLLGDVISDHNWVRSNTAAPDNSRGRIHAGLSGDGHDWSDLASGSGEGLTLEDAASEAADVFPAISGMRSVHRVDAIRKELARALAEGDDDKAAQLKAEYAISLGTMPLSWLGIGSTASAMARSRALSALRNRVTRPSDAVRSELERLAAQQSERRGVTVGLTNDIDTPVTGKHLNNQKSWPDAGTEALRNQQMSVGRDPMLGGDEPVPTTADYLDPDTRQRSFTKGYARSVPVDLDNGDIPSAIQERINASILTDAVMRGQSAGGASTLMPPLAGGVGDAVKLDMRGVSDMERNRLKVLLDAKGYTMLDHGKTAIITKFDASYQPTPGLAPEIRAALDADKTPGERTEGVARTFYQPTGFGDRTLPDGAITERWLDHITHTSPETLKDVDKWRPAARSHLDNEGRIAQRNSSSVDPRLTKLQRLFADKGVDGVRDHIRDFGKAGLPSVAGLASAPDLLDLIIPKEQSPNE